MSREFGTYYSQGYFHTKLENAAEDAALGTWERTRQIEPVLRALYDAAYVCASVEAYDRSESEKTDADWRAALEKARAAIDAALAAP